jgi:hypothetical protein
MIDYVETSTVMSCYNTWELNRPKVYYNSYQKAIDTYVDSLSESDFVLYMVCTIVYLEYTKAERAGTDDWIKLYVSSIKLLKARIDINSNIQLCLIKQFRTVTALRI